MKIARKTLQGLSQGEGPCLTGLSIHSFGLCRPHPSQLRRSLHYQTANQAVHSKLWRHSKTAATVVQP